MSLRIVKVMGGLGNQMFAWAMVLALRNRGHRVKLDLDWYRRHPDHNGWELPNTFDIDWEECDEEERLRLGDVGDSKLDRFRKKVFGPGRSHFREREPGYDERWISIEGDAYFEGFWQSPRYHSGVEDQITNGFQFYNGGDYREEELKRSGKPLVGIHVRRGDYVGSTGLGDVCGEIYLKGALEFLLSDNDDPVLLYFSDDLDWCRDNLQSQGHENIYVDWNRGKYSWRDMRLMARCSRLAIANSSFSWWAARLGNAGKKVFAPDRWYGGKHPDNADIAMPGWIRLAST